MIVELGHFALILAFATALYQTLVPLYGAQRNNVRLMQVAAPAAAMQFVLVAISFAALTYAYLVSDFSVLNVWANSHTAKPTLYKITGVWSNHEGSILLWALVLTLFGLAVALFSGNLPLSLKSRVIAVQGSISVAFLSYVLFASNPFIRIPLQRVPLEGRGINPLLQDLALAMHPPLLYAGYVGFSVTFAFAIAALMEGKVDAAWARWVRPWAIAAWMFLTAGIALGSWWAYYELGWGGWWFWDPVENASFMPWLAGTALLHSAIVAEKRDTLKIWTILLAIVAFSLSLIGTFLVRSGVLSSVHAFAVDPGRGVFILMILLFFIGGSLALYAARAAGIRRGGSFAPVSREGALVLNNLLLSVAMAAVFIGTLFPLAYEAVTGGGKITVGPPYFNFTFGILMIPLLVVLPVGALLPWKKGNLHDVMQRLWWAALLTVAAVVIAAFVTDPAAVRAALGIGLGVWIIAGTLVALAERAMFGRVPFAVALRRLAAQPGQTWGMVLAHVGLGVMVIGIIIVSAFKAELITTMTPGKTVTIAGMEVKMLGEKRVTGPNWLAERADFAVTAQGRPAGTFFSEKRVFIARREMPTTEVGLMHFISGDLYVAIGDKTKTGRVVRLYFNPMIWLLWLGATLMFAGGLATLADRRFRLRLRQRVKAAQPA